MKLSERVLEKKLREKVNIDGMQEGNDRSNLCGLADAGKFVHLLIWRNHLTEFPGGV